jgi:hypothetical protein
MKAHRAALGWPERQIEGTTRAFTLDTYFHQHQRSRSAGELSDRRQFHAPDAVWLFDTIIPPFQRALVWDEARMIRLIESIICGISIGTIVVNDTSSVTMKNGRNHPTDRWLIDGQQRLSALERYFDDAFAVYGTRWSKVPEIARRDFLSAPLPAIVVHMSDETALRTLYDRMNFGGVAHTPTQAAITQE